MRKLVLASAAGTLLALCLSHSGLRWLHSLLASRSPGLPEGEVADVAIVLGYALFRNGSLTEPLKGRVQAGVDLFVQGRARHLLFSGSHPGGVVRRRTEANVMREYAEGLLEGDPAAVQDRWLEEDASRTTYENALYSLSICRSKGWRSLVVVTSSFHQLRSERVFRRLVASINSSSGPGGEPPMQVYMADTAFAPHTGYWGLVGSRCVDLWDWVRELLAVGYYCAKDRL